MVGILDEFHTRLARCREERGIKKKAEMARLIGVSTTAYQKYEDGTGYPTLITLIKISNALGVTTDYLLKGHSPVPEQAERLSEGALTVARYYDQMTPDRQNNLLLFALRMRDASAT